MESELIKNERTGEAGKDTCLIEESGHLCCFRKKIRSEKEQKDLLNRLNRIEGQIRGIKGMLENALNSFTKVLLAEHIKSCVAEDVKAGNEEKLDELVRTLQKLMK